jgi:hypothetical protein
MEFSDKNFIIIIGSARSGSTWLQILLSSHPEVSTSIEFPFFCDYIQPLFMSWKEDKEKINKEKESFNVSHRGALSLFWSESDFQKFLYRFTVEAHRKILDKKSTAKYVIDKDQNNSTQIEAIHFILPEAKFIHIIRDGRDVICSKIAAKKEMGFGQGNIIDAANVWRSYVLQSRKAKALSKRNYIEIKYEDLLLDGNSVLKKLFKFCNLKVTDKFIDKILRSNSFENLKREHKSPEADYKKHKNFYRKGKIGTWKSELGVLNKLILGMRTNDLLMKLNYEQDDYWFTKPRYLYYLLLPIAKVLNTAGDRWPVLRSMVGRKGI